MASMSISSLRKSGTPPLRMRGDKKETGVDEKGILHAFLQRRRKMEQISRLTDNMLVQASSIMDLDACSIQMSILDDMSPTEKTGGKRKGEVRGHSKTGRSVKVGRGQNGSPGSPEVTLDVDINQKIRKLQEMRDEQHRAVGLQIKPSFLLNEAASETPVPPAKFDSTSLAFALEAISICVKKVVSTTDDILLQLSVLDRRKIKPVTKEINTLRLYSREAIRCYGAAIQHLKLHEACERALQDGTFQELSSRREQFLMRKEILTGEEQKVKVLDEHLQALKTRLSGIDARCRMWSSILLNAASPVPFVLESPPSGIRPSSSSFGRESPHMPRTSSLARNASISQHSSVAFGLSMPKKSASCLNVSTQLMKADSSLSIKAPHTDKLNDLDAMELYVASFWCNPYVGKAKRCVGRLHQMRRQLADSKPPLDPIIRMVISASDIPNRRKSSLVSPSESHAGPRAEVAHVGSIPELSASKISVEIRLGVILRNLLRLVPHDSAQDVVASECGSSSHTVPRENDAPSLCTDSIADTGSLTQSDIKHEMVVPSDPISESVKKLLKFLDQSLATMT